MKKLLTILGSVGLIATTSAAVIACGDKTPQKLPDIKSSEKSIKENKEKTEQPKKEDKEKQLKEENVKKIQSDQSDPTNNYSFKRSLEENFKLIKKYGKEAADVIFPRADLIESFRSKEETKDTISLISKIISIYTDFNNYSNVEEFKSKSTKYNLTTKEKELDKLVTKYEEQKDNISKLLEKFK
ncbi:lipoprotein [Mycoplasma mycoides]|uniref:lipoprotein n=1 Tax=Mycoplasma mycoides TaxID=2102 RepID=UPI00223EAD3B|nr:lipoprotein [Mycoplasma mycoides]QVJ95737.1 lipoprotein [Mycoplasma mycoides subsp. capri]